MKQIDPLELVLAVVAFAMLGGIVLGLKLLEAAL